MIASTRARVAADARAIASLGGPLLGNNLSITGMSFADTVMAGQLGARDLGGLAIGAAYYNLFVFIGIGLFLAVSPTVAHAYGADDPAGVRRYARQSWWLVLAAAVFMVAGLLQVGRVLPAIGIAQDVLPIAIGYVHAVAFGMPGLLAFLSLRYASEGLGRTKPIMYIGFLGLVANVFGNWVFMYGKLGMPVMGAVGCGVSTAITMWLMLLAMWLHMRAHRAYRRFDLFARFDRPDSRTLIELMRIGAPIAGSVLAEGGLFVAAALMMGAMGAAITSGHQIALNFASFMFMVPLAISSATTIHVGHTLGRGDRQGARAAGLLGIAMCATVMCASALGIVLLKDHIAALYTRDAEVRTLASMLLLMAALFQLSDGVQVGAAGALRGFKDTAVPMALCVVSYWLIGFTLAYMLGVRRGGGPVHVWIGLIIGLSVSAVLLVWRYLSVSRGGAAQPPHCAPEA
ncbi:MAG TPA: MATE family efflux transporter [Steroidobacter sp.]|jgi:MATE family multidrug resistance protein|nr:MATE family efflux transporter [Steroidobacteraceae bacterium]HLS81155.1 MATE family efflux transporter [Steroidobacter sp.]